MAATAEQISRLRRMVAEPTSATYNDTDLAAYIERYPVLDELGHEPYYWSYTTPPTPVTSTDWVATYDLNAAAADIWTEKANDMAADFDYTADGATFHRSQAYTQAMTQARFYASKRRPRSITLVPAPIPTPLDDDE